MSSSTSDPAPARTAPGQIFGWPTGEGMLVLVVATTLAVVPFLATMASPATTLGPWGYAAWLAAAAAAALAAASGLRAGGANDAGQRFGLQPRVASPLTFEVFHARMGGWGNYIGSAASVLGSAASSGAVALVMAQTLLPGREVEARLLAVAGLVAFVLARSLLRQPPARLVIALVLASVLGLLALAVHLIRMVDDPLLVGLHASAPLGPTQVLEAGALLVFALRPLVRMRLLVPSLPPRWRGAAASRGWRNLVAGAAIAFGIVVTQAIDTVLEPAPRTGVGLAEAVATCGPWVDLLVRFVTVVFGTVWLLVSLDDARLVAGRIARANAMPDIFTPEPGRRRGIPQAGDMLVLLVVLLGVLFAPDVRSLVAFAAFSFLVTFGSLHIAVILTADRHGRWPWRAAIGTALTGLLLFSLPPEVILAGVGLVSLAVTMRAIFIVWIEPQQPDIVEGLDTSGKGESSAIRADEAGPVVAPDDPSRRTEQGRGG